MRAFRTGASSREAGRWAGRRARNAPHSWSPIAIVVIVVLVGAPSAVGAEGGLTGGPSPASHSGSVPGRPSSSGVPSSRLSADSTQCGFYGEPDGPAGAVYDYVQNLVFVSDSETNEIYVLSASNETIEKTIWLGTECVNPFGMAYDPELGEVFVAETGNGAIVAISDTNYSIVATIPVPGEPWNLAYDSGLDELFATDPVSGNITVVSLRTENVVATIVDGRFSQPIGITYTPFGWLFVANSLGYYSDTVTVISDDTDSILFNASVNCEGAGASWPENPFGVAYDSRTGNVYVSCELGNGLAVISPSVRGQVGYVSLNDTSTAIGYDATTSEIWAVSPFSGRVYAVSDATGQVVSSGLTGGRPFEGLAIDNRTGDVFVTDFLGTNVTVLNAEAGWVGNTTLPFPPAESPLVSGADAWVLVFLLAGLLLVVAPVLWVGFRKPPARGSHAAVDDPLGGRTV